jgi:hypothetical protein
MKHYYWETNLETFLNLNKLKKFDLIIPDYDFTL